MGTVSVGVERGFTEKFLREIRRKIGVTTGINDEDLMRYKVVDVFPSTPETYRRVVVVIKILS